MPDSTEQGNAIEVAQATRIAAYDDFLSPPLIVDIQPTDIRSYIEQIAAKTYELSQARGGSIAYSIIKEVAENFIHAQFKEPTISIMDHGNTIRFADQGPGIADKERAQLPGFSSATSEMKEYINGVGSGLPTAKEYLRFSNGRLTIEDNIKEGTVVTIAVDAAAPQNAPVIYRQNTPQAAAYQPQAAAYTQPQQQVQQPYGAAVSPMPYPADNAAYAQPAASAPAPNASNAANAAQLDDRDFDILQLALDMGVIGPTEVVNNLGLTNSTAYRAIRRLEERGLLARAEGTSKRVITDAGLGILNG